MAKTDTAVTSTSDASVAKGKAAAVSKKADKPKSPKAASKKNGKVGLFTRVRSYFRNVAAEMKRVVWPKRDEVVSSSGVVIVTLLFFTAFALVVDQIVIAVVTFLDGIGG